MQEKLKYAALPSKLKAHFEFLYPFELAMKTKEFDNCRTFAEQLTFIARVDTFYHKASECEARLQMREDFRDLTKKADNPEAREWVNGFEEGYKVIARECAAQFYMGMEIYQINLFGGREKRKQVLQAKEKALEFVNSINVEAVDVMKEMLYDKDLELVRGKGTSQFMMELSNIGKKWRELINEEIDKIYKVYTRNQMKEIHDVVMLRRCFYDFGDREKKVEGAIAKTITNIRR